MKQLFLLAQIAGTEIAICSCVVELVISVGDVVEIPGSDPTIAGLFALRSRVLTLIDSQFRVTGRKNKVPHGSFAVMVEIDNHIYGLIVDRVMDVIQIEEQAVSQISRVDPKWQSLVDNVVEVEGRVIMVVDPASLVSPDYSIAA